jgi:hypothetical protein
MDAIKILGELLGNEQMSHGSGQQILKAILGGNGGGSRRPPQPMPSPRASQQTFSQQPAPTSHPRGRSPAEIMRHGGDDATAASHAVGGRMRSALEQFLKRGDPSRPGQEPSRGHAREDRHAESLPQAGLGRGFPDDREAANRQAQALICGMINAAKSDGRIDRDEQQNIIRRMGHLSQEEIQFLQHQFARPLDVQAFAREVPRGLEDEVYAISLTAIDLDTNREARYLQELAHALDLSPDQCNQIHAQLGAPKIFA